LTVRVEPGFRRVTGTVRVTFTPNRSTAKLVFRLWPNGPLQRADGQRLDVGAVSEEGRRLHTDRPTPTMLVVRLGRNLAPGASVTVSLPWTLRVPRGGNDRIAGFRGGLRLGSFFPILAWDPGRGWVTDPPARILAESSTTPTADFDVRVQAPRGTRAVVSGDPAGNGVWHARAVRDVAVAAGPFRLRTTTAHVPGPVTVRLAYTTPAAVSATKVLQTAKNSLERLSRMYGPYPWRTYTVVLPRGLGAEGIEYPTLTYVGSSPATTLVVRHETGHQWFYSLVGNDQYEDPWLDEALATWSQARLGSSVYGPPPGTIRHVGAPMSYWNGHVRRYFLEVYAGGVAALRSLGPPDRVDCALRLYVARDAYRIARPGDLLDALNAVLPGAEATLRRFGIHR
jgi:peptidase M1-like protein